MLDIKAGSKTDKGERVRKGRPTRAASDALHAGILKAATDLFMEEGFSASMESVATAARVSKRTLYAHYPSKLHLYEAVLTWLSGDLAKPAAVLSPDLPLDEAFAKFCDALLDLYTRSNVVAFAKLIQKESARFPELDVANRQQFADNIVMPLKAFLDARKGAGLRDVDTTVAARLLCAVAVTEITRMHAQNALADQQKFRDYMASAIDMLLRGILDRA